MGAKHWKRPASASKFERKAAYSKPTYDNSLSPDYEVSPTLLWYALEDVLCDLAKGYKMEVLSEKKHIDFLPQHMKSTVHWRHKNPPPALL